MAPTPVRHPLRDPHEARHRAIAAHTAAALADQRTSQVIETPVMDVAAGETVSVTVEQESGGALDLLNHPRNFFGIEVIE